MAVVLKMMMVQFCSFRIIGFAPVHVREYSKVQFASMEHLNEVQGLLTLHYAWLSHLKILLQSGLELVFKFHSFRVFFLPACPKPT